MNLLLGTWPLLPLPLLEPLLDRAIGGVGELLRASSALWMKWQRGPYGQKPIVWKVRHSSVLYLGWRIRLRNSCIP